MKKILFTLSNLNIGGTQRLLLSILKSLDYNKYEVDLCITQCEGELINEIPKEVNIIKISTEKTNRFLKLLFPNIIIKKYILSKLSKNYDIAIAFDGYNNLSDLIAAYVSAKKKYIWVHSCYYDRAKVFPSFWFKLYLMRKKYNLFNKIIFVSNDAKESFYKVYKKIDTETEVIWNYFSVDDIDSKLKNNKDNIKLKGKFNFVSVGRMWKTKNFKFLIKTFLKLNFKNDIKLYIIGDGPDKIKLKNLIKKYSAEDKVILLGKKENPYNIMKNADCLVVFSKYEGFGIVMLESLYLGVPIIALKAPGVTEVMKKIAPKNSGFLIDKNINCIQKKFNQMIYTKSKKEFFFDYEKYNQKIKNQIELLLND